MTLEVAAVVLARLGEAEPAAVLAGAFSAHFTPDISAVPRDERMEIGEAQSLACHALGEAAYRAALALGPHIGGFCAPVPAWMQSDAEDADAPGGVLDHGQDIGLGAIEQVGGEEVARRDRLGLGVQELRPGRRSPPRRQDLSGADPMSEPAGEVTSSSRG